VRFATLSPTPPTAGFDAVKPRPATADDLAVELVEHRPPESGVEELTSPVHRAAALNLLVSVCGAGIGWIVFALWLPPSLHLPVISFGLIATAVAIGYVVRSLRCHAYRARITPTGLELHYAVGNAHELSWASIESIERGGALDVHPREGRPRRIPDTGAFAEHVVEIAGRRGVRVDGTARPSERDGARVAA